VQNFTILLNVNDRDPKFRTVTMSVIVNILKMFHILFVAMCMVNLHTKFHMPSYNDSSGIVIGLKAKHISRETLLSENLYIL
jgi:uncharacterized membrane protein